MRYVIDIFDSIVNSDTILINLYDILINTELINENIQMYDLYF